MNYFKDKNNKPFAFEDDVKEEVLNGFIEKFGLTSITETEFKALTAPSLDELKTSKLSHINTSCEAAIVGGFTSSALGSVHIYQSDRDDQINLMGLVTAGADDLLKCGVDDGNGNITWDWKQHTTAQLKAVFDDGALFKKQQLIKANTLKAQVSAATTAEELDGIVW